MQVIVLLLLSIAAVCAGPEGNQKNRWVNDFDKPLNYTCQNHQSINLIISIHDNKHEDRVWDFRCQNTFTKPASCYWTSYVNDFDQEFTFVCPFGSVLSGMESYHNNWKEDRRWEFYCCKGEVEVTRNCKWSGYVNDFDKYLRWDAPTDYYLTGAHSYHDNKREDRLWSYHSCEKNV
ncbi:hemagglutinin/amebocyte aggregation factor-like [Mixophyes fleayi]|uniref:hemagglutinin/amebocyte aggregation factor-like n=1 Tax=Mixophyes fleayi TaxID=3061075 RepID=UPI003F4DE990